MSYQEKEISRGALQKHLEILDFDEGLRIETTKETLFINKTPRRFCIEVSGDGNDEFVYMNGTDEVFSFLSAKIDSSSKFFSY